MDPSPEHETLIIASRTDSLLSECRAVFGLLSLLAVAVVPLRILRGDVSWIQAVGIGAFAVGVMAVAAVVAYYVLSYLTGSWHIEPEGLRYFPRYRKPRFLRWADVEKAKLTRQSGYLKGGQVTIPLSWDFCPLEEEDLALLRIEGHIVTSNPVLSRALGLSSSGVSLLAEGKPLEARWNSTANLCLFLVAGAFLIVCGAVTVLLLWPRPFFWPFAIPSFAIGLLFVVAIAHLCLARGTVVVEPEGVRYVPVLRGERFLRWCDVEAVRWYADRTWLRGRSIIIPIAWRLWPENQRARARRCVKEILSRDFDLSMKWPDGLRFEPSWRSFVAWLAKMFLACALYGAYVVAGFWLVIKYKETLRPWLAHEIFRPFFIGGWFFLPVIAWAIVIIRRDRRMNPTWRTRKNQ